MIQQSIAKFQKQVIKLPPLVRKIVFFLIHLVVGKTENL